MMPAPCTALNDRGSGDDLAEQRRELHSYRSTGEAKAAGARVMDLLLTRIVVIPPGKVGGRASRRCIGAHAGTLDSEKPKIADTGVLMVTR